VHPFALALLEERGIATTGLRSKSWDEFAAPGAPGLDYVLTVCDNAAGETCPYWPGHPATAHWGIPDPAAVEGSDGEKRRAFRAAFERRSARIGALQRQPLETHGPDAAVQRLREIGRLP
jgi:arsenate reductase